MVNYTTEVRLFWRMIKWSERKRLIKWLVNIMKYWFGEILEIDGGVDGTRTRDLCSDSAML